MTTVRNWARPRVLPSAVATLNSITPCFIVDNLQSSLDFYQSKLGFEIAYKGGGDGHGEDFWAFVRRDGVMISLKAIAPEIHPRPNHSRHEWARWDAYVHTSDPDSLYSEYVSRAVPIHKPLKDTEDGLRAFEITDNNGYVLLLRTASGVVTRTERKSPTPRKRMAQLRYTDLIRFITRVTSLGTVK
jgi:catechol 2,3-dioxygenase-like lactoylglutathione lyase family enzyme